VHALGELNIIDSTGSAKPLILLDRLDLRGVSFDGMYLANAYFEYSDLRGADFRNAGIHYVNFTKANLREASITRMQLAQAFMLRDATLPDGTICGHYNDPGDPHRGDINEACLEKSNLINS
jgi:uncharacterized protein YjbI with pentapeptide repeats